MQSREQTYGQPRRALGGKGKGVASIQMTKELVFSPTTKRLETGGTMRVDFLMCGIGSDARGFR